MADDEPMRAHVGRDLGLNPERTIRLLRAKAGELENYVTPRLGGPGTTDLDWLVADVALIFGLLADEVERNMTLRHTHTKTGKVMTDEDFERLADEAEAGYDVSQLKDRRG